jgi:hypothetical protein
MTHDPYNHPRYRQQYPCHARMLAEHPKHADIPAGHYFFYARNLGGHVQALHESFAVTVLIPKALCELSPAAVALVPAPDTAPPAVPSLATDRESLRRYLEEVNACRPSVPAPSIPAASPIPVIPSASGTLPACGSAPAFLASNPSPTTSPSTVPPSGAGRAASAPRLPGLPYTFATLPTT